MRLVRMFGEMAVFVFAAISLAMVAVCIGLLLSGCAPQQRKLAPAPVVQTPPSLVQPPSALETLPELVAVQSAPQIIQKPAPRPKKLCTMAAGGKCIVYERGKKNPVSVPEFGPLTIMLPEGESYIMHSSGNNGEWPVEVRTMGRELPIVVVTIRRFPYAATAELHVTTDAEVYQFILTSSENGVSKNAPSLIAVTNPETEARLAERQEERRQEAEERRRAQSQRQSPEDFSLLGRPQ